MDSFSEAEKEHLYHLIGMGALKYFLLKVDPKKRILFNPEESIELQGHTGPFIQYTHARIKSVLSKAGFKNSTTGNYGTLEPVERDIIVLLNKFPEIIKTAAETYSPAIVANYVYELAKAYNKFYQDTPILKVDDENAKQFRLQLSSATAKAISKAMSLLGIEVPERM
jgi:arginyl-tRNA synthetase